MMWEMLGTVYGGNLYKCRLIIQGIAPKLVVKCTLNRFLDSILNMAHAWNFNFNAITFMSVTQIYDAWHSRDEYCNS